MDLRSSGVFCQASLCGLSKAAGRYGDLRVRSKSDDRALIGSRASTGFPAPDLFDHFAHAIRRLLTLPFTSFDPPYGCPLSPSGSRSWILIIFVVFHHCPYRSGHLVRQSNSDQHFWFPNKHASEPRLLNNRFASEPVQPRHGTDNQQLAYVSLSGLGYASQSLLPARGVLSRDKP